MWRHGLLLRCKPSYLIFKDPVLNSISKTSYLNPKIYVKNIFTTNLSLFPVRSYSKAVGLSEVLPEISLDKGLEVKRSESVDNDIPNQLVLKRDGTDFEDKPIDKVISIKNNVCLGGVTDSEELCLNGVKSILKATDSEDELKHLSSPGNRTDSEDKVSHNDVKLTLEDITIKINVTDLEELSQNDIESTRKDVVGLGLGPIENNNRRRPRLSDSKERARPWSYGPSNEDENAVRRYDDDQQQMLFEAIYMTNELTTEQWDELHKKVLSAGEIVNELNIQASIMEKCLAHKRLGTGLSYLNYLSASAQEPNIVTIGKFCRLSAMCPSEVNDNIQNIITSSYDSLRARYPAFDASTADSVIHGLSVTKRWKEGLEILDEIRLTCAPHKSSYSALIKASFDNDEPDIGWELLSKTLQDNKTPMEFIYESYLQYCRRSAAGNKAVEQRLVDKLLHFMANNDIRLTEKAVISLRLWFEYDASPEADWNVQFTTVDSRGMCQTCHQHLKPTSVSREEFESLKSVFIDKAIVGSNIFLKSTPEELQEFHKFIKETAPYDVVIDGLNVSYSAGAGKGSPNQYAKVLQSVVEHFVKRSEKVIVLGRRHMFNWPKRYMDFVFENAEVFLANNLSQDDPYLLYAAMYSGLGTRFVSRDLMRGHAYLLKDPKLQAIFQRWQKQYQLQVTYTGDEGYVKFKLPQKYNTSTQCNRNGSWHIPYNLEADSTRHQAFNVPRQWLCLTRFKERRYDDGFEDDPYKFANNRHENRVYSSNNNQSQFRRSRPTEDSFDSSDDENAPSRFQKRNYGERVFDDNKESKFGRIRAVAERHNDYDDDEDKPSRFTKRRPTQVYSTLEDYKDDSAQFRKSRYVDQRFGGEQERQKFRPVSKMTDDEDSSDEQTIRSKKLPSEERFKEEMLQSESRQAFKSNRTQEKPVRKADDSEV